MMRYHFPIVVPQRTRPPLQRSLKPHPHVLQRQAVPVAADKLILNNPVIDEAQILSASEKQALEQKTP